MKKLSLLVAFITATIFLLSACSPKTDETPVVTSAAQPDILIAEGRLFPVNSMEQSFDISGRVIEVLVTDGEQVEQGQEVAHLQVSPDASATLARAEQEALSAQQALDSLKDSGDLNLANARLTLLDAQDQLDLAQSRYDANDTDENKARLDIAQANLAIAEDNVAKLESGDGVDPDQLEAARARLTSAQAVLSSAQALIESYTLKATMSGSIVDLSLQAGQLVLAGSPVMTIADYSSWIVETDNLSEIQVVNVEHGQQANIVLDALPGETFSGEVTHINARYEEKRGDITYTVTILLSQTAPLMRWGMTAAVQFVP